jgi:hypothetical protein
MRHYSRLLLTVAGSAVLAMTQAGPSDMEINFCEWPRLLLPDLPERCLRGLPVSVVIALAVFLIVAGLVWFFWPKILSLISQISQVFSSSPLIQIEARLAAVEGHLSRQSAPLSPGDDANPGARVELATVIMDAWERVRTLEEFSKPPSKYVSGYPTLLAYYERDPSKLAGIAAQIIFNSAEPPIPIWGVAPPRKAVEKIPREIAMGYLFSGDAKEMFDVADREKPPEERHRYTNLQVRKRDIERRISQMVSGYDE